MSSKRSLAALTAACARSLEQASWLDRVADPLAGAVGQRMPRKHRGWLSGTWLGHPLHPFLVTAPVGAWTSSSILDMAGQRRAAQTLVGAGVLSAVPVALSGLSDWVDTDGAERRIGVVHLACNAVATGVYAGSWWARRRGNQRLGMVLGWAGAALASGGGWLGGHLAYSLGVGVDTNAFDGGSRPWTSLDVTMPRPGVLVRAAIGPTPLLVACVDGEAAVLGDRCSHRGAPLSDGEVRDGCVVCPWHASRFDLTTGEARRGPAVVAQPVYTARVRDATVEVCRDEQRALRSNTTHPAG